MKKLLFSLLSVFFILYNNSSFAQGMGGQINYAGHVSIDGATLNKYVDPLPNFANNRVDGTKHLTVTMKEFQQKVLPSTFQYPAPYSGTLVWGYQIKNDGNGKVYGPLFPAWTIEAKRGAPTVVKYVNELGTATTPPVLQSYLITDQSIHWANPLGLSMNDPNRMNAYVGPQPAVVHLHGGEVPSAFDGGPDEWFTPGAPGQRIVGSGFINDEYIYPNTQQPTTLWYHDHTLGMTRLNVYAGLAGFYFLRDVPTENQTLPSGNQEIEVVVQDRMFDTNGQLFFPDNGAVVNNVDHPFWIPEFFGDVMVVNGKAWPYFNVEPRRYRFHFLNGCNARFLNMWLTDSLTGAVGPDFYQIAGDQGYLNNPVLLNKIFIAPGEREDIIIDFSKVPFGSKLILRNNAPAPYPMGDPMNNDPNTNGQVMEFRVVLPLHGHDASYDPANPRTALRRNNNPIYDINPALTGIKPDMIRQLTLKEFENPTTGSPEEVLVNNSKWSGYREGTMIPIPGSKLISNDYITELPQIGATEIWQIINLTPDAHPIHLHLTEFQLISRQAFDPAYLIDWAASFPGGLFIPGYGPPKDYNIPNADGAIGGNPAIASYLTGSPFLPDANERGWKDTFKAYPGEIMTLAVRYAPQDVRPSASVVGKNYYVFDPTAGPEVTNDGFGFPGGDGYVWHCHIIDHEDNEMMRPLMVMDSAQIKNMLKPGTELASNTPGSFSLDQNYPNPFNPTTTINFSVPENSPVSMKVYNILGKEVATLVNETLNKGSYKVLFNASNLASGFYVYKLSTGSNVSTKKMLLLK